MIFLGTDSLGWIEDARSTPSAPDAGKSYAGLLAGFSGDAALDLKADAQAEVRQLRRVSAASWDMATYVDHSNARSFAEQESMSRLIDAVKRVSGIKLDNPGQGGFEAEAEALARQALGSDYARERQRGEGVLGPYRREAFETRLRELTQSDAKIADAVATAKIDFSPQMIARRAAMEMDAAMQDASTGIGIAGQVAGGILPAMREPLNLLATIASGGSSAAAGVAGRLVMTGVKEAVLNGLATAAQQPDIQAWRNEIGLPSGWNEGVRNTLLAAAIGGTLGVGFQGVREIIPKFVAGDANAGEVVKIADALGLKLPAEDAATLRTAARSDADDALVLAGRPAGHSAAEAENALRQNLRWLEEPGAPPPDAPLALSPARPGAAAIDDPELSGALAGGVPMDAVRILRERPELLDDSLPVDLPMVRQAVQLARLSDEAFAQVEGGLASPTMAAQVAAQVPDALQHAAVLGDVARLRPETDAELRFAIADAAEGRSAFAPRDQTLAPASAAEPGTQGALDLASGGRAPAAPEGGPSGDLLDRAPEPLVPLASRDSEGFRMVAASDAFAEADRTVFAADLISACRA